MKVRNLISLTACVLLSFGAVTAQNNPALKFTSLYTDLKTGCKTLKGYKGTDNAYICQGAGDYQVRIFYSAASSFINAERKGTDKFANLAALSLDTEERKITLEWRLADGKPFAVIMRVPIYTPWVVEGEYYGKVIGQRLIVRGLLGFEEKVKGEVNTKKARANEKARALADNGYLGSLN